MTVRQFTLSVSAVPTGLPQWITDLPINSGWVKIAAGPANGDRPWDDPAMQAYQRGNRIWDVRPSPLPPGTVGTTNFGGMADIIRSWTGGSVDPVRKEMILSLNGGHANYIGNETYALQLNQSVPAWKRLCDPTPDGQYNIGAVVTGGSYALTDVPATHFDGRPRASHTSGNMQFANGRVWFILQTSVSSGSGASAQGIVSFNRDAVAALPGDFAPYATLNPYETHGIAGLTGSTGNYHFCSSAYDPVTGNVWGYGRTRAWAFNVETQTISQPSALTGADFGAEGYKGAWAVCLPDQRKVLIGVTRTPGQPVWVHDLTKSPGTAGSFVRYNTTPALQWDPDSYFKNYASPGVDNGGWNGNPGPYATADYMLDQFSYGMGAVYTGGQVYVGPVPARRGGQLGGAVRVLSPSTMTWTEIPNTGVPPVALNNPNSLANLGTQNGNFQRFNLVQMDTVKLLIHAADVFGPTHVWRLS